MNKNNVNQELFVSVYLGVRRKKLDGCIFSKRIMFNHIRYFLRGTHFFKYHIFVQHHVTFFLRPSKGSHYIATVVNILDVLFRKKMVTDVLCSALLYWMFFRGFIFLHLSTNSYRVTYSSAAFAKLQLY